MVQIKELQEQLGFAVIFVTHDMSLVSHFSDRLLVMYAGQVAELSDASCSTAAPSLLAGSARSLSVAQGPKVRLLGIPGSPPDLRQSAGRLPVRAALPVATGRCLSGEVPLLRRSTGASFAASSRGTTF